MHANVKRGRLILMAGLLTLGPAIVLWNQSRPGAETIERDKTAYWASSYRYERPSFASHLASGRIMIQSGGIDELRRVVLETTPVRNPVRILWEHLRYWMNQGSLPVKIQIESDKVHMSVTYFQHGKFVFLRHKNEWLNSVRTTEVTINQLENLLLPFIVTGPSRFDPNAPAEAEPPPSEPGSSNHQ